MTVSSRTQKGIKNFSHEGVDVAENWFKHPLNFGILQLSPHTSLQYEGIEYILLLLFWETNMS